MTADRSVAATADPALSSAVSSMLHDAWTAPGFCVPNGDVYPHQWLWDSCFHAVVWTRFDTARALTEIANVLAHIGPSGFVPHMTYWNAPTVHAELWGRSHTSSITQPPMWGLALSELVERGGRPGHELLVRAARGLTHLLDDRPRSSGGLVPVFHPWETGCDDSARWDDWATSSPATSTFDRSGWKVDKLRLVRSLVFDDHGAPVENPDFAVGSVGFTALVAWNCELLAPVVAAPGTAAASESAERLRSGRDQLVTAIRSRWSAEHSTWWDEPLRGGVRRSCGARTLDSMLALLVDPRPDMFDQLVDPAAFGAPFGPRGVHRSDPTYHPDQYWRGPAWPQLSYLFWRAARRAAREGIIDSKPTAAMANGLVNGAARSGLAEYWNPETGAGRGAAPQTWAGLAACV